MIILKRITYTLALFSGLIVGTDSVLNAKRASDGCGEYSMHDFVLSSAIAGAATMLIPTIILMLLIILSWNSISARISSVIITVTYTFFCSYHFLDDVTRGYVSCDNKGDDTIFFFWTFGMFGLPLAWSVLGASLHIIGYIYSLIRKQT
jgi:hypothetical protein